ncbi:MULTISPECIES: response regulator [unclassified Tolypothrix]|uniref:response regulator n=1 Tax=unclassified Tolypothrix TaxID=2649714 RepID=UPI0005EAC589|nr:MULTISPECIES: response regulator [unclassified Tolypothrix]BAY91006.1 multi-component transcriptional regulator, winged helix family protein [Microchaete diplosiphon NIES-3275]EKE99738.1 response regulator [Tolypothrix sp. PCC 7601]MBE9087718.1 response regulator [Tolypothrix sp. LEGE 11397]UYD25112.1 response regulator [Tolypothrix sp. PCC 7712]UYD32649.1 response regulator [Tolypothrix sp. PCC 7601]
MKLLLIEDDESLAQLLRATLIAQNYQVELAPDGQQGWDLAQSSVYDLIVLDLILPKLDGINFCKRIRLQNGNVARSPNQNTPILLLTALDSVMNKVIGLDAGADDYMVKPVDLDEFMARVRSLLRRSYITRSPLLEWGELCLNPNNCQVTYQGQPILLTAKEYAILELFLRNPDHIFSASLLIDRLWTSDEAPSDWAVRTHVKGLRNKLKKAGVGEIFETIYKLGYRLKRREQESPKEQVATSPILTPSSLTTFISDVWEEMRETYCDRLMIIQQAVTALKNGQISPELQQAAEYEAHTLIGSLGSFGLGEASRISRQIQQILTQAESISSLQIQQLVHLVSALQQEMQSAAARTHPAQTSGSKVVHGTSLLIVDDDAVLARHLATKAAMQGIVVEVATDLQQAESFLVDQLPDVILLDLNFPGAPGSGLNFLATLYNQHPNLPVLVLTAKEDFAHRLEAARLGSKLFLQKPIAANQVLRAVTQVLQQSSPIPQKLLIMEDDPQMSHLLRHILQPWGYHLTLVDSPQNFWTTLEQTDPDLLILDIELSDSTDSLSSTINGLDLCQVIRNDFRWQKLPILFLSAHTEAEIVQQCFAAGGDDFLYKSAIAAELLTRVRNRLEQR